MTTPPEPPDDVTVGSSEVGADAADAIARRGRHRRPAQTLEESDRQDREWDIWFKKVWGNTLLGLVVLQIAAADVGFFWYAIARGWNLDQSIAVAWLSAAVVQVIGLAWLVVRSVFPPDERFARRRTQDP